jgi:segregation and condensation protein B
MESKLVNNRSILEAILFVAEQPIPAEELAEVLEIPVDEVEAELDGLAVDMAERGSGVVLRRIAAGWRCYSNPDAFPYLERFASTATATRLSNAALEVLAVVAYRQPVSRNQIAEIRGVDSDSSIRTLERRGLIEEIGRLPLPGTPTIYGTTQLFLEKLGLESMDDLPPLADHVPPATVVETLEETFRADG